MGITIDTYPTAPIQNYEILRSQIRSGDILLCSGNAFFSHLIQKTTNSVWSHIAFILRLDIIDRIMVLESVESIGVRTVPLSSYAHNYNGTGKGYPGRILLARHSQFDPTKIANLSKTAVDLLGYPYDKEEILRIANRIITKGSGLNLPSEGLDEDQAYICSEYAYKCFESVGVHIEHNSEGFVTPADFARCAFINAVSFIKTDPV